MILSHQHFDLLGHTVLEHVIFHPPMKADASMKDEACLLYSINGQSVLYGELEVNGIQPKEGVIMKCGSYINSWLPKESDEPNEAVAVHFLPEVLKLVFKDNLPDFLKMPPESGLKSITNLKSNEVLEKYIQSLIFYFENPELINEELIILKVKEIILLLINTDASDNIKKILNDLFNPQDSSFRKVIDQHLYSDLNLEELAVLTNCSLSTFKRRFKEIFQHSPGQYIKEKRLEKSKELLLKTNKRIADIAFECGYNDPGHFSKSFAAYFGYSPSSIKNRLS